MGKRVKKTDSVFPDERERRTRQFIKELTKAAIEKRSAKAEFHGLEREFIEFKLSLLEEYRKSKNIKHVRDLGNERETILRRFLTSSGLLPKKYGVSEVSARVVSQSGHISREMDIVFFNKAETIVLMRFPNVLEHYPIESVHGVIQVKSRLTAGALREAFENIASYKRLERPASVTIDTGLGTFVTPAKKGFGMVFAYESELAWLEISDAMKEWAKTQPSTVWPNAVVVLHDGFLCYRRGNSGVLPSDELEGITEPEVFGYPDRDDVGLYRFYKVLMDLLSNSFAGAPPIGGYYRLPQIAGQLSYEFSLGFMTSVGQCKIHGHYLREINQDKLRRIISTVEHEAGINWIRATDLAYGKPGDREEAYRRQPGDVRIYNPDGLPLREILVSGLALSFDSIDTAGMTIWLPHRYTVRDSLIGGCPECSRPQSTGASKKKRRQPPITKGESVSEQE